MPATDRQRPIYLFVHIPKTGGTTLLWHLNAHMKGRVLGSVAAHIEDPAVLLANRTDLDTFDVVFGHGVSRAMAAYFPEREPRFITTLRDPIDHAISLYNWTAHIRDGGETMRPFERWYNRRKRNPMARWLAGRYAQGLKQLPMDYDDARLLAEAQTSLQQFWLVADNEKLEPTLRPLFEALGIPPEPAQRRRVAGIDYRKVYTRTPALEALVRERAQVDFRLYEEFCGAHRIRDSRVALPAG